MLTLNYFMSVCYMQLSMYLQISTLRLHRLEDKSKPEKSG